MAQWVNRLRNNSFVNTTGLPLLCLISGALHLAQPGLTLGRLASWLAGRQNTGDFRDFQNLLWIEIISFSLHLTNVQHYYSCTNAFK